jgi:hypothetical protein
VDFLNRNRRYDDFFVIFFFQMVNSKQRTMLQIDVSIVQTKIRTRTRAQA